MTRQTLWAVALATVAVAAVAGSSFAQEGGRGGRRGSRGGSSLLSMPEVQKELNLQQAQIDLLQALRQNRQGGDRESLRSLSREERTKRFTAMRLEREKKVAEILDAKQVARLKQLELQQAGPRALGQKDVADALKLTPDQRQKVDAAVQAERETMRQAFAGFGGRNGGNANGGTQPTPEQRQQAFQKMREMRAATATKLNAVLTDGQKKQFQSMQGAPFQFPERRGGRRGGQTPNN
jgi:Spy/CpxP family protein refolding chaperone